MIFGWIKWVTGKGLKDRKELEKEACMITIIQESTGGKFYIEDLSGEKSLLRLLQEQRLGINAPCDGKGNCGRCRVRFLDGAPAPTKKECDLLTKQELTDGVRLACAVHVTEACQILIEDASEQKMAVLTQASESVKECVLENENVEKESNQTKSVNHAYAIAIDLGTTTLAAELFDMADGKRLAVASGVNHQRAYGADVISRINAANEGKLEFLRKCVCEDVVSLIEELQQRQKEIANAPEITHIAIVGNTTMCHLLRGLSCLGLGRAPFTPTDLSWHETDTKTLLGMEECNAKITILPGISAFVGADIVAGIYASGLHQKSEPSLLLDIGTNGEMVFTKNGELLVTSTAVGPVFEGGNISCGVPATPGAISCVEIEKASRETKWNYKTIGNRAPIGLCGTGIIDFVSALTKTGWVDENGTLEEPWFAEGVQVDEDIIFTQSDIREVQMAKAAIRAGIEILLSAGRTSLEDVNIYLAGGFGQEIDVEHAIAIGMFPETFKDHTVGIGNSALQGAKGYLLADESAREEIDRIISSAREINLATHQDFEELYIQYMSF